MCSDQSQHSSAPDSALLQPWCSLLSLHILSVTYGVRIAQNWLTLMSGLPQKQRIRTPLLRLQCDMRKLTPPQNQPVPRRERWLKSV